MIYAICTFFVLTLAGLTLMVRAAFSAPHGVEDDDGFRLTEPSKQQEENDEVLLSTADLSFFTH